MDELFIRKNEFHYSLSSKYSLYEEAFQPLGMFFLFLSKKQDFSFFKSKERLIWDKNKVSRSLHQRYLNRLMVRREIVRLENTSLLHKNILWWKVRLFGCNKYFSYLRKVNVIT